jgi:hypothetical protein
MNLFMAGLQLIHGVPALRGTIGKDTGHMGRAIRAQPKKVLINKKDAKTEIDAGKTKEGKNKR